MSLSQLVALQNLILLAPHFRKEFAIWTAFGTGVVAIVDYLIHKS